jgi:LPS-assembly protein
MSIRIGHSRIGPRVRSVSKLLAGVAVACLLGGAVHAQTLNDRLSQRAQGAGANTSARLLVEARELVYDRDKNSVSAVGEVQLYYQGRVLEAERVTYNRSTNRVFAEGNAKLTDEQGNVYYGTRFELTDDFKDGFIDSLLVESKDKTRFSAPRAERTGGETTTFERGTYTACEPCKDNPSRPPLWQVRAARIIHNNAERMVYYEDARLEFWGVPIAYLPYLATPDPTVTRKTGLLAPRYVTSSAVGAGVSLPFFLNLAPNYDLTITPTLLSRQGFLGEVEWRHRLEKGSYNVRAAGINQLEPSAFLAPPFGARNKDFRGSIETTGKFFINDKWTWGWDIALMSDKWFFQNYKIKSESIVTEYNFFKESISTIYLTGKGERSFFDARGYYFRGLSYQDWQKQLPVVRPVIDYNRRFDGPGLLGGEVSLDANITSIYRDAAQFVNVPDRVYLFTQDAFGNPITPLYDTCAVFQRGVCLVRGVAGSYTRASVDLSWRRKFVDPLGQVWTPFASMRADGAWLDLSRTGYQNSQLPNFIDTSNSFVGRAMPTVGLEYRYPFVAATQNYGTHIIEPIAQIVARPNETQIGKLPNEDAQSLVFDDTTLFSWNKFSGYDRVEGGTRLNLGAQYSVTTQNGAYGNMLFGQSYQLAGANSFRQVDLVNTGLQSGLDTSRSDYVGRIHLKPNSNFGFTARARFDENDFAMRRLELTGSTTLGPLSLAATYARFGAQPLLGQPTPREGVLTSAYLKIYENWNVNGAVLLDLDRHDKPIIDATTGFYRKSPVMSVAYFSVGAGYKDECITFGITYANTAKDSATGTRYRDQTVLLRLELRTLGEANFSQNVSSSSPGTSADGISR